MTILIADDDREISHLMCTLLRDRGHTVIAAFDAMQAMMYATRQPVPDLILLDIHMPAGTGLKTLATLKQLARTESIPVVVVTGSTEPGIEERVAALGAVAFLSKPIDPELFLATVRHALGDTAAPRAG